MTHKPHEDMTAQVEKIVHDAEDRMKHAVEHLKHELGGYRTGRANPALLERIHVDYYGTDTPLHQMANISVPEPRVLAIQPWDRNMLQPIEKAILKSDLGINPSNDGTVIRLNLPQLTEERRKDLIKQVHKRVGEGRVAIRNIRRDAVEHLRALEKQHKIGEDARHTYEEKVQKITKQYEELAEKAQTAKEAELMEV